MITLNSKIIDSLIIQSSSDNMPHRVIAHEELNLGQTDELTNGRITDGQIVQQRQCVVDDFFILTPVLQVGNAKLNQSISFMAQTLIS